MREPEKINAQLVMESLDEQYSKAEKLYFKYEHKLESLSDTIDLLIQYKKDKHNLLPHKRIIDLEHKKRLLPLTINIPLCSSDLEDFKSNIRAYQKKHNHDAITEYLDTVFNKVDQLHIMSEQLEVQLDEVIKKNKKLIASF